MSEPLNQIEIAMIQTTVAHYARCMKAIVTSEVHQQYRQLASKLIEMECDLAFVSAAAQLGKRGGQTTSTRKADAVRKNGKLGGRPQSTLLCWECASKCPSSYAARFVDISSKRYYQGRACSGCNEQAQYRVR